jgi:hypothetical protein
MVPSATQVPVCECARSEVAQAADSLRCVSEGTEYCGANFSGFAGVINKGAAQRDQLARPEHRGTSCQVPWLHWYIGIDRPCDLFNSITAERNTRAPIAQLEHKAKDKRAGIRY